jgi:protoporphyrinogen oxidase
VIDGLEQAGLIDPKDVDIVYTHLIKKSYPVPVIGRDDALNELQPRLEALDIFSRGRFGAWKYEYGNMDHSVTWGLDIVRLILDGQPERQKAHD